MNRWAGSRTVGVALSSLLLILVVTSVQGAAAGNALWIALRPTTVHAFESYVRVVEALNDKSLRESGFLWVDELSSPQSGDAYRELKNGAIEMRRMNSSDPGKSSDIPGGMIHDWEGIVFIPGAKLDQVLKLLQDYNEHAKYYTPDVERAKLESRDGDHFRVYLRFRRKKIVTVVLNTQHDVTYYRDSPTRAHSRSSAIRIAEVEHPGSVREKEKAPGNDNGYLWRMETWWRMEEKDGGVYVQNEAVTLTRDIPTGLAWLIEPFISSIPKETLEFTLGATRKAVIAQKQD
jgi:hypothetical protein